MSTQSSLVERPSSSPEPGPVVSPTPRRTAPAEPRVKDLMSRELVLCRRSDTCEQVAELMRMGNVGMIPVMDGDRIAGIVTDRDLTIRHLATGGNRYAHRTIINCMTPKVVSVGPDAPLSEAIQKMTQHGVRRLPVAEGGKLVGVISMDDIIYEVGRLASTAMVIQSSLAGYRAERNRSRLESRRSGKGAAGSESG